MLRRRTPALHSPGVSDHPHTYDAAGAEAPSGLRVEDACILNRLCVGGLRFRVSGLGGFCVRLSKESARNQVQVHHTEGRGAGQLED